MDGPDRGPMPVLSLSQQQASGPRSGTPAVEVLKPSIHDIAISYSAAALSHVKQGPQPPRWLKGSSPD